METINFRSSIKFVLLATSAFIFSACSSSSAVPPIEDDTDPPPSPLPTNPPEITDGQPTVPDADWNVYQSQSHGLSFQFPSDWYGPEVYEVDQDLRIEIGTDVVYPYGTDRTEQIYTQQNSYYILIQYRPNTDNSSLDDYAQTSWISPMLDIQALTDGESVATARSLIIRVRAVDLGRFTGVEYISTLSDTAQTERTYSRHLFLMDENLNILMISGTPNNVEVLDPANWKDEYQRVDESYLEIFHQIIETLVIE